MNRLAAEHPEDDRFMSFIVWNGDEDECWTWEGSRLPKGYGRFSRGGEMEYAHRVSYELFVGPIPEGLHIDHLCRNPRCVNPEHLEPVTNAENHRRGDHTNKGAFNAAKTHCPKGHPYSGDNLYLHPNHRWRSCRKCKRDRDGQRQYAKADA